MGKLAMFRPRTTPRAEPAPSQGVTREEALRRVCALPEPERRALVYVTLAGLRYAEIARLMDCPQPDVQRLIAQAREHLGKIGTKAEAV